ncbi:MAG: four helix bundle suffix domain-containing protein [Acidobacteria bacterium]|nr:four helix bundle suffix domain-containing protein [Acidobacteriota bacterium]MCI0623087.1 four helix bundle suffix domain-containing protein [Acidobacteriota bacterium]MCI0721853.1 four helix bundle suffix domain-containing protein [Acidobacteriota bacterium]
MTGREPLIPKHGGYRKLKSFQLGQLIYDITVRFCDRYISPKSRTHDQMVQAARSGVQNIAEGGQASGTSKKMELKLTNVARASLEELRLDYEDFLRQRRLPQWPPDHPALRRFKATRCSNLDELRAWVEQERRLEKAKDKHGQDKPGLTRTGTDASWPGKGSLSVGARQCLSVPSSALVANAALSLLNLCCHLLNRQLAAQAGAFEREGGFTERLHRMRTARRNRG